MIDPSLFPAFRETLVSGGYNLLLGAGVSLDSTGPDGKQLPGGEELRKLLCKLTDAPESTTLTRVYRLLTADQITKHLVDPFAPCEPGFSVSRLSHFVWRRLFTLNIDDVVERHYELKGSQTKQAIRPINYDSSFEPTPERFALQAIHLHGSARHPDAGFVFSPQEYARVMRDHNPWMRMLAEILATEPFMIAGTALNEPDLEYYLSYRTDTTPRRGIGPSFLIEPSPDVVTKADCERHGLTLVAAPFGEFLEWVAQQVPAPPSIADLLVPDKADLFESGLDQKAQLRFFSDFELVEASDQPLPDAPSPFLYGREPDWRDLDQHFDIVRSDYERVSALLVEDSGQSPARVVLLDNPGTGKTTCIKRVAHMKARAGLPVVYLRTFSGIDVPAAKECLAKAKGKVLLVVDNVADHAAQLQALLDDPGVSQHVTLLGAERSYRRKHVELLLGGPGAQFENLSPISEQEALQLLERFRHYALVGDEVAQGDPGKFAGILRGEAMTLAVCRILNDFRPLDAIAKSLWTDTDPDLRHVYLCVAVAQHCHWTGLRYSIAQKILGPTSSVSRLLADDAPLRLTEASGDGEFLLALNWAVSQRIIHEFVTDRPEAIFDACLSVVESIAPYVNRRAIIRRTPEARLAGRFFDFDTIVGPLLKERAAEFYHRAQPTWEWNSRYWEQRALLYAESNLETALRHARHAVSVERHPHGLTTLGKILLMNMEADPNERDTSFEKALESLTDAIETEAKRSRVTIHPFMSLLSGTSRFLELGGHLSEDQRQHIVRYTAEVKSQHPSDTQVEAQVRRLDELFDRS